MALGVDGDGVAAGGAFRAWANASGGSLAVWAPFLAEESLSAVTGGHS